MSNGVSDVLDESRLVQYILSIYKEEGTDKHSTLMSRQAITLWNFKKEDVINGQHHIVDVDFLPI